MQNNWILYLEEQFQPTWVPDCQLFKRAQGFRVKIHNKTCNTVKSKNKSKCKVITMHYNELAFGTNISNISHK